MILKNYLLKRQILLILLTVPAAVSACSDLREPYTLDSTASCDAASCHGAAPMGIYPPESGKHSVHLAASIGIGCSDCHNAYYVNPLHNNSVLNGYDCVNDIQTDGDIVFFDAGREEDLFSNPDGAWDNGAGACSNMNCHVDAQWYADYGAGTSGCLFCHASGSSIDPLTINGSGAEGKHLSHVQERGYQCGECHKDYKTAATHINGEMDGNSDVTIVYFLNESNIWNNSGKTCSVSGCHPDAGWYSSECANCHGNPPDSGAHGKHITGAGYACGQCHFERGSGTDFHFNSAVDVNFDGAVNPAGSYVSAAMTCESLSCHGDSLDASSQGSDTSPEWDDPSTGDCGTCHVTNTISERSHPKHVSDNSYDCDACHNDGTLDSNHHYSGYMPVNNIVDVVFDSTNPSGVFTDGADTCASLICHGSGTPAWGGESLSCGDCHGNPPDSNAHSAHVSGAGYACGQCHFERGSGTDFHFNSAVDVNFDGAVNPAGSYVSASMTCESLSCHGDSLDASSQGSDTSPEWDVPSTGACGTCHDNPPTTGAHSRHVTDVGYTCDECHLERGTGTSYHVNMTGDVNFDSTLNPAGTYTPATETCDILYCHGSTLPGGSDTTPEWDTAATGDCGTCHDTNDSDTTPGSFLSSGSHTMHINDQSYNDHMYECDRCHFDNTDDHHSSAGMPVNGTVSVIFDSFNPSGIYSSPVCSNLYCHGSFDYSGIDPLYVGDSGNTADWTDSASGACGTCHSDTQGSPTQWNHFGLASSPCGEYTNACHISTMHVNGEFNETAP